MSEVSDDSRPAPIVDLSIIADAPDNNTVLGFIFAFTLASGILVDLGFGGTALATIVLDLGLIALLGNRHQTGRFM